MGETENQVASTEKDPEQERIPVMQKVLDNPFLLLFLGVVIPAVLYVIWGVMEIISIPIANY
ncbi:MAG: hypothetical protein OEQ18_11705 [Gammaproteobacteria bacterium]|nr:hypothetical protein [Gammaproteobacteria bacterium]